MPLLSKQALPVSYRLKSAQSGEVVEEERGEILDCILLTLMSEWEKVAPQKEKFQRKSSNLLLKLPDSNLASSFISYLWAKVTGKTWTCHDYWRLMTHAIAQWTQRSWIIIMTTQIPVSSAHQGSFFSLLSLVSIISTNTRMIHWEKNESTCGDTSNLSDWHDWVSVNQTRNCERGAKL